MNTSQIQYILSHDKHTKKYFLDVFPSDHLPRKIKKYPACFVVNVDSSSEPGSHWVAFYLPTSKKLEFFDSYGNATTYFDGPISKFASRFPQVTYNPLVLQSNVTAVCGQYCIYYLYSRCRDVSLKKFLSSFVTKHMCNDQRVYNFVSKRFRITTNFFQ